MDPESKTMILGQDFIPPYDREGTCCPPFSDIFALNNSVLTCLYLMGCVIFLYTHQFCFWLNNWGSFLHTMFCDVLWPLPVYL